MREQGYVPPILLLALGAFALGGSFPLGAQAKGDFCLSVLPQVDLPLGPSLDDGLAYYSVGGGAALRAELRPGFARFAFGRAFLEADYLPLNGSSEGLALASLGAEAGALLSPSPRLAFELGGGGGAYLGSIAGASAYSPFAQADAGILFRLTPTLTLSLGGGYKYLFWEAGRPLYHGLSLGIGVSYDLAGASKGSDVRLEPSLAPVFPLYYTRYDKERLGTALLANGEGAPIEKVRVSFYAKQYMDSPRLCAELASVDAGARVEVSVYALFNDSIFKVTEGTKASGELTIDYYYLGKARQARREVTLDVFNRNAMTWDDDRKAAAFVTAKDPLILGFAKGIAAAVRNSKSTNVLSAGFRAALAIFQGLSVYGLGYVVDPATPYASLSADEGSVDFLQFPSQTLAYRGGDCDDLTTLYCALLESAGIETAFITVPGHIFAAFDSGIEPSAAAKVFSDPEDAIVEGGKLWIPVEITMVKEGFLVAWGAGAREWREATASGSANFYEVRQAWRVYEPVGFAESAVGVTLPALDKVVDSYASELSALSQTQVARRASELLGQIKAAREPERLMNKLGILYAQYGLLEDARAQFAAALERSDYGPALVNLANVEYLEGDNAAAAAHYRRAVAAAPGNAAALAGLAKACKAAGDSAGYREAAQRLAAIDQGAAAGLSGASPGRAAGADEREVGAWDYGEGP